MTNKECAKAIRALIENLDYQDIARIKNASHEAAALYVEWRATHDDEENNHDNGYLFGAVEAIQKAANEKGPRPEDWTTWQWIQYAIKETQHVA